MKKKKATKTLRPMSPEMSLLAYKNRSNISNFCSLLHNFQFREERKSKQKLLYCILGIEFLSTAAEPAVWLVDHFSLDASEK